MLRRMSKFLPFVLALCGACYHNAGKPPSPKPAVAQPTQSAPTNSSKAPAIAQPADPLRLTATRTHDGHTASATVLLREPPRDAAGSPHLKLAGARAWVSLGEQRVDAEDWAGAIACARAGLAELGPDYARREALDHTDMKLLVARDDLKKGDLEHAAKIMVRQLTVRTEYYVSLHAAAIAE